MVAAGEPTLDVLVEALRDEHPHPDRRRRHHPAGRAGDLLAPPAEVRPPADFLPRGALELVLHAQDVCGGLGLDFDPPSEAVDHLRHHVADWPFFAGYWEPLGRCGRAWRPRRDRRVSGRSSGRPEASVRRAGPVRLRSLSRIPLAE